MDELKKHYDENLKFSSIIKNKTGKSLIPFWLSLLIGILGLIILTIYCVKFLLNVRYISRKFVVVGIWCICILALGGFFRCFYNYYLKAVFGSKSSKENMSKLHHFRINSIKEYVVNNKLSHEDIRNIMSDINRQIDSLKPSFFSIPGLVVILFTIYVEKYTGVFIELYQITDLQSLKDSMLFMVLVYILLGGIPLIIHAVYKNFYSEYIFFRRSPYEKLYYLLSKIDSESRHEYAYFEHRTLKP